MKKFLCSIFLGLLTLSCSDDSKNSQEPVVPETSPGDTGSFERMPYISEVKILGTVPRSLALIGVHLKPTAAVKEANLLDDLYLQVSKESGMTQGLLLGDMNLSCSYASDAELDALDMRQSPSFNWLIPDTAHTNVAETACAYDRIVAVGEGLSGLGEGEVDSRIIAHSDHKPIWTTIDGVRIGAFNTKVFGETKAKDSEALKELAEIVCSGDLILLQEIVTIDTSPVEALLARVRLECGDSFQMKLSERTGTTNYKERFAYFYRPEKIEIMKSYLVTATITDTNKARAPDPLPSPTSATIDCGENPYKTPAGYCYASKEGAKKRVANSCCP